MLIADLKGHDTPYSGHAMADEALRREGSHGAGNGQVATDDAAMLCVESLRFSYGNVLTLRGIDIAMPKGRVTCIMGRNGVGKTTLMKNIMGLLRPSAGSVQIDGRDVTALPAHRRVKAGLALVPQDRDIFPKLTVEENLRVALVGSGNGHAGIPADVYDVFPDLKPMAKRMGGDLSGGQQQQLAIARALVARPKVLLLDEPTEGIQPSIIRQIGKAIRKLVEEREMTVVLVEQYVGFVKEFGHHVYFMHRGRLAANLAASELTSEVARRHLAV